MDDQSQATLDTALAFMAAMGEGDQKAMLALMADDMVWHNEGDKNIPWIGNWKGKVELAGFLGRFFAGFKTTLWETEDTLIDGDTGAFFGHMGGIMTNTGKETGAFTFGLRVKVKDGKITLWNWLEDSYSVSQAYKK